MKITIYELLGMIKDGKAPKKIIYNSKSWEYDIQNKDYITNYYDGTEWLFDEYAITDILTNEVEILETTITYKPTYEIINNKKYLVKYENGETLYEYIEDYRPDKIEKLEITQEKNCNNNWKWKLNGYNISTPQKIMGDKINEIIDYILKD